jgi:hypothetical protein
MPNLRPLLYGMMTALMAAIPAISSRSALADPVTVEGITFSDEKGNFRLVSVTGKGTTDDPFVVKEEITGPNDPVLVIEGFTREFGNRVGTQHTAAFDQYVNSTLPHSQRLDEPEDSLGFGGDSILPGGEATFRFIISDMSPIYRFYLIQRPQQPLS